MAPTRDSLPSRTTCDIVLRFVTSTITHVRMWTVDESLLESRVVLGGMAFFGSFFGFEERMM